MISGILLFTAGIALFLLGMTWLSGTVQRNLTGSRIREYFSFSVRKPIYGIITGAVTTILFQSSSATSVLTVGLVSAGLISFFNSLGIILGSDIGTTLTVQLVVWKITDVSPVFIVFGGIILIFGRGKWKLAGEAILYFGLIFFGLSLVSLATEPLKNNQTFITFFQETKHPFYALLMGLAVTAIIQSSAIPISILAILAHHGFVTIEAALPIIIGANIGTSATALLAGLAANINGKKCALSHFLFKLLGAIVCLILLPAFLYFLNILTSNTAQQIALGHFFYNLLIVIVFTPMLAPFSALIERLLPAEGKLLPVWPEFLDDRVLSKADAALDCAHRELGREVLLAYKMCEKSIKLISNFSASKKNDINFIESAVDNLRREIGDYLCKISTDPLSPDLSKKLFSFSAIADDIERIADHAVTLSELAERKHKRKIVFTEFGKEDLREITDLVTENMDDTMTLVDGWDNKTIERIFEREELIDRKVKEMRERHLERHYKRICAPQAGPIFIDILIHLERISDHCENIAEHIQDMGAI
jgi:phosphate:Na+ symporter